MIKNEAAAKQVSDLMLAIGKQLDDSLIMIEPLCSAAEFSTYRQCIGRIMGEILVGVLNRICLPA